VHLRWCGWALAACLLVGALACNGTTAAGTLVHGPTVIEAPGTYLLGGNLSVPGGAVGIEVRSSDVTLDGNGWTVRGSGEPDSCGVLVHGSPGPVRNVTVRNIRIADLHYGCYAWDAANVSVDGCLVESCAIGVTFNPAADGSVLSNRLEKNGYGVVLSGGSTGTRVASNRVTDSARRGFICSAPATG